jgi:hypothetical protein
MGANKKKKIDIFHCEDDAFDQGFTKYGNKGFMVRQIEEDKPIFIFANSITSLRPITP